MGTGGVVRHGGQPYAGPALGRVGRAGGCCYGGKWDPAFAEATAGKLSVAPGRTGTSALRLRFSVGAVVSSDR